MTSTIERRLARLEQAPGASDHHELVEVVAQLSPIEREQRLLAIRLNLKDDPAAEALLDQALEEMRSPELRQ
jgi:hypothetical protein